MELTPLTVSIVAVSFLACCLGVAVASLYKGTLEEAARWRHAARTCTPVASYEDGNAPSYHLVVALDDVQPGTIPYYDVTDARTGRAFRVKVVPLELAPPEG